MKKYLALFLAVLAVSASAQTTFTETEANETKATANAFTMVAGDMIVGNSTGSSTTVGGSASADTFKVTVGSTTPGIFERRLTITTTGTAGHTGSIRGLTQSSGAINTTDTAVLTSATGTTPARFVQWYGWGAQESLYYRVTGSSTTTGNYTATLSETAVSVADLGSYAPGSFTFDVVSSNDTELMVFNSSMSLIGQGDDDASATTSSSLGAMNLSGGTYYIAIGRFNSATNIASGLGISGGTETFLSGNVTDFGGLVLSNSTTTSTLTAQLRINGANAGSALGFTPYSMNWYKVQVVPEPGTFMALGLGGLALIRRKRK